MDLKWWKEAIVYQIYPKSFCDSNGDGIGDIKGITAKLDYIKALGIDVIWLSPFFKSPMKDDGYDISDYYEIEDMFGSTVDIDELLAEASKREIKILMDLVFNHSSSEHTWFKSAIGDPNSPFRDYYIFKDLVDGKYPNNWRSVFGGSVWEPLEDGSCYMHTFDKSQPDLNWENPQLREELYKVVNYWIQKGVSGFRIDAITFIKKNQIFMSLPPDADDGLANVGKLTMNQEGIHLFLQEMKEKTYGKHDLMTVAEAPGVPYNELLEYIGENGDFSMIFDFSYCDMDVDDNGFWYPKGNWNFDEFRSMMFKSQRSVQKVGWGALFLESHDQPRCIDKFFGVKLGKEDDESFRKGSLLATMYFLLRGTPFIYQGQEIGMRNLKFNSIQEYKDIATKYQYMRALSMGATEVEALHMAEQRSRDHSRTPMQWDDSAYAGFSQSASWLPVHVNYKDINIHAQIAETASLYHYYKQLINLRKSSPYKKVLIYGGFEPILEDYSQVIAYKRFLNGEPTIVVVINMAEESNSVEILLEDMNIICSNYHSDYIDYRDNRLWLKPYEAIVLALKTL